VKQAFVRLAREYHPDKLAGSGMSDEPGLHAMVDALFKRLGDAHQALANAEARAAYDRTLESLNHTPAHGVPGGKVRRPAEALNAFKMGDTFFKKKDFKQAEMHLRQAAMFDPEDPKILTALAWCIYSNPEHEEGVRLPDARKRLQEVTSKYKLGDAHYKLGLLLRKGGDEGAAQRQFSAAAKLDPNHTDAVREVRLLEMRTSKDEKDEKGGLFGKFLRK
jgi:tetratricopeptide (TPR) repeat protein